MGRFNKPDPVIMREYKDLRNGRWRLEYLLRIIRVVFTIFVGMFLLALALNASKRAEDYWALVGILLMLAIFGIKSYLLPNSSLHGASVTVVCLLAAADIVIIAGLWLGGWTI